MIAYVRAVTIHQDTLELRTRGEGFYDITAEVQAVVARSGVRAGACTVFLQHTSASLVVQENADPAVLRDLSRWMSEVAPHSRPWEHDAEGPDDMPAHARCAITRSGETIPVVQGRLALGTWQALYVWEHRTHGHRRRLVISVTGE
jgi:secondary thiamine-phosphate synthase enzyme